MPPFKSFFSTSKFRGHRDLTIHLVFALVRAVAGAGGAVALEEDEQAVEGEHVVDVGDEARAFGDHVREASAGDDLGLRAEFGRL